jgi:type I restriction enzyme, S subunit
LPNLGTSKRKSVKVWRVLGLSRFNEWPDVALGDVAADITVGHVGPMATEYKTSGVPFLRSQNVEPFSLKLEDVKFISAEFHGKLAKSSLAPGDVVIVRTGKPGAAAVIPQTLPIANCSDLVIVRPGKLLDSRFIAYYVNSAAVHHVSAHLVGAVQQHFNVGSARSLKLRLPPVEEQRAISSVLGSLDDKIDLNRRMNQTLEAMARAIFKSWFVDFDPVREGHPLFPSSFQESPLGLVPSGWEVRTLEGLCQVAIGGEWGEDRGFEGAEEVACLRGVDLEHLRGSGMARPPRRWISSASLRKRQTSPCDLLVAASGAGPVGRSIWMSPAIGKHFDVPIIYSNFCKRLTTASSELAIYLDRTLHSLRETGEIFDYVIGTSVPNLDLSGLLRSHLVVVPSSPVLEAFGELMKPIYERLYSLESSTLVALRDTLLPKLLSGEIRVKQAEKIVGEAV